jgi:cell division GTPase FtsZ
MSTGTASGENKAEEAVKKALDSPLLNDNKITGAKNVLSYQKWKKKLQWTKLVQLTTI